MSNKHLRIYTVVYENDKPSEVDPLVYAEDLSRNGTYWNGTLIGKGNGGFLLTDGDTLRLSCSTWFSFQSGEPGNSDEIFDLDQEKEMKKFSKEYIITDRLLGAGAFGKVFMAVEQFRRSQLACKVVNLRGLRPQIRSRIGKYEYPAPAEDVDHRVQIRKVTAWAEKQKLERENQLEETLKTHYREADILARLKHPNIIGLEKVFVTDNTIYIFQDLITAGDLFSYLELKNGFLMDVEAAVIVRQILFALEFLHERNIVHRDLKPDNILMTNLSTGCRVVLTDFGAARKISNPRQRMISMVGTAEYNAPEIIGRQSQTGARFGYTKAVDMWALGCVTVTLLTGGSPFRDPVTHEYSTRLAGDCDLMALESSSDWKRVGLRPKAFVRNLLCLDEQARLTAKYALLDPWFSNEFHKTDFDQLYQRTIKHWKPRVQKKPVIEFVDAHDVKWLQCSQDVLGSEKKSRTRGHTPVEPPYKPFPRQMHQPFFPQRRSGRLHVMSEEVLAAIKEHWSDDSDSKPEVDLPTPTRLLRSSITREPRSLPYANSETLPATLTQSRKPGFKPLRRKAPTVENSTPEELFENSAETISHPSQSCHEPIERDSVIIVKEKKRPPTPRPNLGQRSSHSLPLRTLCTREQDRNLHYAAVNKPLPTHGSSPYERPGMRADQEQPQSENNQFGNVEQLSIELISMPQTPNKSHAAFSNSDSAKANSKLRLRTLTSTRSGIPKFPDGKKRRRDSIFDIEEDESFVSDYEAKRSRAIWQSAKMTFRSHSIGPGGSSEGNEVEEDTFVLRTPSLAPNGNELNPVFLPRI